MIAENYQDALAQLKAGGLLVDELQDGRLIRVPTVDDQGRKRSGWYLVFVIAVESGERLIVGSFGDWREGVTHKIVLDRKKKLTSDERAAIRKRITEDRKRAEAERKRRAEVACLRAERAWINRCSANGESDYLIAKGVNSYGCRFTKKKSLAIPIIDVDGRMYGVQFILSREVYAERIRKIGRDKEFWPAGLSKRGHFHLIGTVIDE